MVLWVRTNTACFSRFIILKQSQMDIENIIPLLTSTINEKGKMIKLLNKWKNKYQYCIKDIANCDSAFVAKYILSYQKQQSINSTQIDLSEDQEVVSKENSWRFNQFKAFVWIVVGFCQVVNRELKQIKNSQIRFIMDLFPLKDELFIIYNIHRLEKVERVSNKNWSHQQLSLFTNILKNEEIKDKWNIISYELFEKSQGLYYQSPHRCREMWYNHLNPKVRHGEWTNEEDYELFSSISTFGLRWANISRAMDGSRTEHMVKNRYTCLIKRNRVTFKRLGYDRFITYFLKQLKKKVKGKCSVPSNNPTSTLLTELDDSIINNNAVCRQQEMKGQLQENMEEISVQPFMVEWFHLKIHHDDSYFNLEQDVGCRFRQHQTHIQFFSQEERDQILGI